MDRFIDLAASFEKDVLKRVLRSENELDNILKDSIIAFEEKVLFLIDLNIKNQLSEITLYRQNRIELIFLNLNQLFEENRFRDKIKREKILELIDDFITIIESSGLENKLYQNNASLKDQASNNRKIEKRYTQIQETLKEIENQTIEINSYYNSIKNTHDKLTHNQIKIEEFNTYYQTAKLEIEDLRFSIKGFFSNVENYTKIVTDSEQKVKKLIENSTSKTDENIKVNQENYTKAIDKFCKESSEIETKNKTIQSEINTLLQGANASKLAHIYENKRKEIEWQLWFWLAGIIVSTIVIIFISYYKLFDKLLTTELLLERFLIILPILLLDIFFIFQYNLKNKIVEDYRFKSSTATSLFAFNELIKSYETDKSQDFITKSLETLFKSPLTEKDYNNPALSVLEKSYSKIEDRIDKLIEKIPKTN
ncbi:hypothetical protein [Flavobacterium sp. 3HN19-14]|uniref:hypothetical protein n=1 Tax=Flavobacterium sp. 3HN19-14 TaxID=3448133 RepID=UPI003EE1B3AE